MAKEREISKEQILYLLINLREEEAKREVYKDIIVNRDLCKEIGIFNYKIKGTGKRVSSRLFLINETQDGEEINIIYDENGRFIGWQNKENREKNEIEVAKAIELNQKILNQQLIKGIEREKGEEGTSSTSSDTTKAGEGRDLAEKEHEKTENKNSTQQEPNKENGQEKQLINYKNEINIEYKTKIRLDEIINGYYLWQILQYEEKYNGRMPDGLSEASFRSGYLTILDAEELERAEAKIQKNEEQKERKNKKVIAICTRQGDIIELDETILKPEEKLTIDNQKRSEQTALEFRDGEEALKPQNQHQLSKQISYEIPDVSSKFGVAEYWGLQVDTNQEALSNGITPVAGNIDELSFWQSPIDGPVRDKELQLNRYVQKLEAINESPNKTKEEIEQQEDLKEKGTKESVYRREEHFNNIVEEAFKKHEKLKEYFNKSNISEKVKKYHNMGMKDEQILEQIGKELHRAEEIEHEFHIHGRNRKLKEGK